MRGTGINENMCRLTTDGEYTWHNLVVASWTPREFKALSLEVYLSTLGKNFKEEVTELYASSELCPVNIVQVYLVNFFEKS